MRKIILIAALPLLVAGCTVQGAITTLQVVAAKIDNGIKVALEELPAACSLTRTASSLMNTAIQLGAADSLSSDKKLIVVKAQAGIAAVGISDACVNAGRGITPANPGEAAAQIVQAFSVVRAAVRGTTINASATAAAAQAGG